jgi:probable aminopeptidase NPEPL1
VAEITYPRKLDAALKGAGGLTVMAPEKAFEAGWHRKILGKELAGRVDALLEDQSPGPLGVTVESISAGKPRRVAVALLPDQGSRHNSPSRSEAILKAARAASPPGKTVVLVGVDEADHVEGALAAVARAMPRFSRKSKPTKPGTVAFLAADLQGAFVPVGNRAREIAHALRWAAEMVDTPTADMTTADLAASARKLVRGLPQVTTRVITGAALLKEGLRGIHAVGRTAMVAPRLLIMEYRPARARRHVSLVGKGVVYDTGGLSLKPTSSMCSMKGDMGGAAAVAGAFRVLAATKSKVRVTALLPLAENAIGPDSYRNDDIITLHSGRTVEINNTDAEGRLLLADAVSYAARKLKAQVVIDAATLTGAQLVATGERHAAVVSNRGGLESLAVDRGRHSGDLAHPLPFAPEFYQAEFESQVADMKNSVKNRMNAQSSCAAQFVYRQIDDLDLPWLHIDLAGPAHRFERGTGYGVALMSAVVDALKDDHLEA